MKVHSFMEEHPTARGRTNTEAQTRGGRLHGTMCWRLPELAHPAGGLTKTAVRKIFVMKLVYN